MELLSKTTTAPTNQLAKHLKIQLKLLSVFIYDATFAMSYQTRLEIYVLAEQKHCLKNFLLKTKLLMEQGEKK